MAQITTSPPYYPAGGSHIGPFVDGNGNVYTFLVQVTETGADDIEAWKWNGSTWAEQDGANAPNDSLDSSGGNLVSLSCYVDGTSIVLCYAGHTNSPTLLFARFNTSDAPSNADTWVETDTDIGSDYINQGSGFAQDYGIVALSDGTLIVVYQGPTDKIHGTNWDRIDWIAHEGTAWGDQSGSFSSATAEVHDSIGSNNLIVGASDKTHLVYAEDDETTVTLRHRSLSSAYSLGTLHDVTPSGVTLLTNPQRFVNVAYYDSSGVERIVVGLGGSGARIFFSNVDDDGTPDTTTMGEATELDVDEVMTTVPLSEYWHIAVDHDTDTIICLFLGGGDAGVDGDIMRVDSDDGAAFGSITQLIADTLTSDVFEGISARVYSGTLYIVVGEDDATSPVVSYEEVSLATGTTVTPAAVAAVATVPDPSPLAAATVTPAAVATLADVPDPTPAGAAAVTPAAVAALADVPDPSPLAAAAVTPAAVAAVADVPDPSPLAAAAVTPAAVATVADVPDPTIKIDVFVTPATVAALADVPGPAVAAGAVVEPASVAAVADVPDPAVVAPATVFPAVEATVAAVPTPAVLTAATVTPAVVAAVADVPDPSPLAAAVVTPAVVAAVADVPGPAVTGAAAVTPAVVAALADVPTPTILTGGTTVLPATVAALADVPGPAVAAGAVVEPASVAAVATVPDPAVVVPATVFPAVQATVATVPTPAVLAAATVTPAVVAALADVPTPALVIAAVVTPPLVAGIFDVPTPVVVLTEPFRYRELEQAVAAARESGVTPLLVIDRATGTVVVTDAAQVVTASREGASSIVSRTTGSGT